MRNVLIVIPAGSEPQQAMRTATGLAKQCGGTLVAVVVLDADAPRRLASRLTEVGFMAERIGQEVSATLLQEYQERAKVLLQGLAEQAMKEGVVVTPLIEQGDAGDICGRVIRSHQIGTAVLVAEKRSWLTRFLSHSAAVQLPDLAGCDVRVMEED